MKLYHVYKKRLPKSIFLGILLIIFVLTPIVFSYAQTAQDIANKITQKNADIAKLEEELKVYQGQLDMLGKQKNSLNVSIKELDLTRKKLVTDISVTQGKIDATNLEIQSLSSDIGDKEGAILNHKNSTALLLRETNEFEIENMIFTVLSKNNFTEVWNDIDNRASVREKIIENIGILETTKGALEDTRSSTITAKNELVSLKSKLADQQKIVVQNTNEKNKLLAQTKNSEASYQALLADRLAKKNAFEQDLRNYESQLKYILDPSSLPGSGVLSWPLDKIFVTQMFGQPGADGKRLFVNGSHNGVDFRASIGTPVKAMADGVVAGTGDTDVQCPGVSFGRFVLIKYNNGLASTYGHLSLIKVSAGEQVTRGEIVGYSGNTGYSTGPHLHVSVYARDAVDLKTLPSKSCPGRVLTQPISPINAYLDPLYYLPPL
ncbi:MAG: peptidoglycan DD-metalloendopeptidase family protein [Patescibacteria group bacterium]|nr:peptidoglycan DD-metalloendopeptidase family protein [Patescibacteria group bacterium]